MPDGVATFSTTGPTSVTASGFVTIGQVIFAATPNAPAYTISTGDIFVVNGAGIFNNSTNAQTFDVGAPMVFTNASNGSGGSNFVTYSVSGGSMSFNGTSTAGTAHITSNGDIEFNNSSTAGTATIVNTAVVNFNDTSSAGGSNVTNNATGLLTFNTSFTAGTLTISNSVNAGGTLAGTGNVGNVAVTGGTLAAGQPGRDRHAGDQRIVELHRRLDLSRSDLLDRRQRHRRGRARRCDGKREFHLGYGPETVQDPVGGQRSRQHDFQSRRRLQHADDQRDAEL